MALPLSSGLEDYMDRGAWRVTVHELPNSWTQLHVHTRTHTHTHTHTHTESLSLLLGPATVGKNLVSLPNKGKHRVLQNIGFQSIH